MSETNETPGLGQADEASADGQVPGGEKSYPEWLQGDPDPDRLVSYADNLRKERADLKDRLAAWDDEEEWAKRGQERFPHRFVDDSEEPDDDEQYVEEDDPRDHKLSELEQRQQAHDEWIRQQQLDAAERQFKADVEALATAAEVELDADDLEVIRAKGQTLGGEKGWGPDELAKAFKWLVDRDQRKAQHSIDRMKSSKRVPHVPAGGNAGKGPQPDLDTVQGQQAYVKERLANS